MPALTNTTAVPRCSFDNLTIACFPNVWIHIKYTIDNTQFILCQSTIFSCHMDISSVDRINTGDEINHVIVLENCHEKNRKKLYLIKMLY